MPEGNIENTNVVLEAMFNCPINRFQHVTRLAAAIGAEHAQIDNVRARRHAPKWRLAAWHVSAVSGDDASDVGAVPVEITSAPLFVREVHVHGNPPSQVAMLGDARIDHGNAHTLPGVASQPIDSAQ